MQCTLWCSLFSWIVSFSLRWKMSLEFSFEAGISLLLLFFCIECDATQQDTKRYLCPVVRLLYWSILFLSFVVTFLLLLMYFSVSSTSFLFCPFILFLSIRLRRSVGPFSWSFILFWSGLNPTESSILCWTCRLNRLRIASSSHLQSYCFYHFLAQVISPTKQRNLDASNNAILCNSLHILFFSCSLSDK